jgi:multicomponent Na+:H+ antiporter subunit D
MSIAGIPPFNGFWSKLIIVLAAVASNRIWYAFFAIVASILTLASFMKVQKYAFFGKLNSKFAGIKEAPVFMGASMAALALICVASGALIMPVFSKALLGAATDVLANGTAYAKTIFGAIR